MPFSAYCTGPGYERMWTSRNPEEKGAIHSCSEHLVMSKIECLCAWDMEKIKSWSHVSRSSVEQKYSTLHRKVEVARLPGEHRRGVQPDRGLREGFWMRESELRRCWAVACRTRSHHSPTLCKLAVAPQRPGWSLPLSFGVQALVRRPARPSASSLPLVLVLPLLSRKPAPAPRSQVLLYTAASPCAHRVTPGTLRWHGLSCLPPLLQGKQLERRLRSPVPSMRPDNRSFSRIVKLVAYVTGASPRYCTKSHLSPARACSVCPPRGLFR